MKPDRTYIEECKRFFGLSGQDERRIVGDAGNGYLMCLWDTKTPEVFYENPLSILRQEWYHAYHEQGALNVPVPAPILEGRTNASPRRLLDYGCGVAALSRAFMRRGAQATLVDGSENVRAYLRQIYPDVWVYSPEEYWGKEREPADILLCMDFLEHIPEPIAMQERLTAVLSQRGMMRVAFSTAYPHPGHLQESIAQIDDWYQWVFAHMLPVRYEGGQTWLMKDR